MPDTAPASDAAKTLRTGPGRLLVAVYGVFALAATALSVLAVFVSSWDGLRARFGKRG